ncbi:MAG TPA: hypothetical protein VIX63_10360 [Vicinamibacterales bacterium]
MAKLNPEQLGRLARLGAKTRLEELREEEAAIRAAFPELFGRGRRAARKSAAPRRRRMSAANRKAVSERMRKYWAERRRAKAGKGK